jgi:hypothetical protein
MATSQHQANISASGQVYLGDRLYINNKEALEDTGTTLAINEQAHFTSGVQINRANGPKQITLYGNVTASGNISASGNLYLYQKIITSGATTVYNNGSLTYFGIGANATEIDGTNIFLDAPVTASGNISASGKLYGGLTNQHYPNLVYYNSASGELTYLDRISVTTPITASGGITSSGTIQALHITASGNISASGTVSANKFVGNFKGTLTKEGETNILTLPAATDTLVGRTTTDTFTGLKTFSSAITASIISSSGRIIATSFTGSLSGTASGNVTPAVLTARSVVATISSSSLVDSGSVTITHNLNTQDVIVQMYGSGSHQTVYADVFRTTDDLSTSSENVITIDFCKAPSEDIRVLITSLAGATSAPTIAYT